MSQTFYSVSAPAGSGKTHALISYAIDLAKNGQKVLIAQPSKLLIDQTHKDLIAISSGVPIKSIVSLDGVGRSSSVLGRVLDHMKEAQHGKGEVLLISQQVLGRLPNAYRTLWHLVVDEVPGAFVVHDMNISVTHRLMTEHLALEKIDLVEGQAIIAAKSVGPLRELAENKKHDKPLEAFKALAEDVLNADKMVCVNRAEYEALVSGKGTRKAVNFYSFQKSEYVQDYASVTMMGANFEDTELYKIWEKIDNITWKPHPVIGQNLRYQQHTNGTRLTIKYVIQGNWSQYFANQQHGHSTVLGSIATLMEDELGSEFIWQANKKAGDYVFNDGEKLPIITHGLNKPSLQRKHGVALVRAINHSSGPAAFLKAIGFTAEELKVTLQYQNEYQAMMRCSLRDPNATEPVTVCVVSEGSARWLEKHFPGCGVVQMKSDIPEPKPSGQPSDGAPKSQAERTWDSREKRKHKEAALEGRHYDMRPWPHKK